MRQADAMLKYKPDIIFREAPSTEHGAILVFDHKGTIKEHGRIVKGEIKKLQKVSREVPWAASDIAVYENAHKLFKLGHRVKIYNVDAPSELLRETIKNKWNLMEKPRRRGSHLLWWVYIYLRERIMSRNMRPLIIDKNKTVLIFLQKFHWLNVSFLLSNPSKNDIWDYYFGRFENINKKNIKEILKDKNEVLYKYWMRNSDFV